MTLPFSTKINGEPTYFPEKILSGLYDNKIITAEEVQDRFELSILVRKGEFYEICFDKTQLHKPKLHTIREDKNDRWKPGVMIDFFINARQPNMFRFAPRIPVVSTQKIEIKYMSINNEVGKKEMKPFIKIDGELFYDVAGLNEVYLDFLAKNDGFDSVEDFFAYFNKYFTGKIIHWTDLKY